jgi:hypothetical protein
VARGEMRKLVRLLVSKHLSQPLMGDARLTIHCRVQVSGGQRKLTRMRSRDIGDGSHSDLCSRLLWSGPVRRLALPIGLIFVYAG